MTTVDSRLTDALRDRYLIGREVGQGGMAGARTWLVLERDRPASPSSIHEGEIVMPARTVSEPVAGPRCP